MEKLHVKYLFYFGCLFISFSIFSQAPQIDWGMETTYRPNVLAILPKSNGVFYTFHYTNSSLMPTPKISKFENGVEIFSKKVDPHINMRLMTLEDVFMFSNRLLALFSDFSSNGITYYLQEYDSEADPLNPPIVLGSHSFSNNFSREIYSHIEISPNQKYIAVDFLIPAKKNENDQLGCILIDSTLKVTYSNVFEINYNPKLTYLEERHVTDEGRYLIGISVFNQAPTSVWKNYNTIEKTVVYSMKASDSLREQILNTSQLKIHNFTFSSKQNELLLTGIWGDEENSGAKGVFISRFKDNHFDTITNIEFPSNLFETLPPKRNYDYSSIKEIDRQLLNYAFRNTFFMPNGDLIILAEQYYMYEINTTDSRGMSQIINYYNYNDCIVYSISSDGKLNWLRKIPKKQESVNDFGQLSSILCYINGGKMHLFFNDNLENYGEDGTYNSREIPFTNNVRYNDYCLAKVDIELSMGTTKRYVFSNYESINAFVCLKLSAVNYPSKQLFFSATRKKDKYGILKFE